MEHLHCFRCRTQFALESIPIVITRPDFEAAGQNALLGRPRAIGKGEANRRIIPLPVVRRYQADFRRPIVPDNDCDRPLALRGIDLRRSVV